MVYGITGWSGGARVPVNYNLRAGQFRGLNSMNVWGGRTNIINNFGCFHHDCCYDNYDSNVPKWMQWTMIGGMITQGLGTILSAIFGGGGGGGGKSSGVSEDPGALSAADTQMLSTLNELHKGKYKIMPYGDGTYAVKDKDGNITNYKDLNAVKAALSNNAKEVEEKETPKEKVSAQHQAALENTKINSYLSGLAQNQTDKKLPHDITGEYKDNKYILQYTNQKGEMVEVKYDTEDAFKAGVNKVVQNGTHEDAQPAAAARNSNGAATVNTNSSQTSTGSVNDGAPVPGGNTGNGNSNSTTVNGVKDATGNIGTGNAGNPVTITITPGQGIIYAINQQLGNKNITPAQANRVMNLIQQYTTKTTGEKIISKLNNKNVALYRGNAQIGNKKDGYGFVVQPNQEITIPAELWSQIKAIAEE